MYPILFFPFFAKTLISFNLPSGAFFANSACYLAKTFIIFGFSPFLVKHIKLSFYFQNSKNFVTFFFQINLLMFTYIFIFHL